MYGYGLPILEPWATINSFSSTRWSINPPLDLTPQHGRIITQIRRQHSTEEILGGGGGRYLSDEWNDILGIRVIVISFDSMSVTITWQAFGSNSPIIEKQRNKSHLLASQKLSWGGWETPRCDYKNLAITLHTHVPQIIWNLWKFCLPFVTVFASDLTLPASSISVTAPQFSWCIVNLEGVLLARAHYFSFVLIWSYISSN